MFFTEISREDFFKAYGNRTQRASKMKFVEDFVNSGIPCAKLEWRGEYAGANTCSSSIRDAIKRMNCGTVQCFMRDGEVYLVRTDLVDIENN